MSKGDTLKGIGDAARKVGERISNAVGPETEKVKDTAIALFEEAKKKVEDFAETERGKKILAAAGGGAVAGVPLPIVGPFSGALLGAAIATWVTRKDVAAREELLRKYRNMTASERLEESKAIDTLLTEGTITQECYDDLRQALSQSAR